eukprot:597564-Lingulodinium_polyedra.AAC.1
MAPRRALEGGARAKKTRAKSNSMRGSKICARDAVMGVVNRRSAWCAAQACRSPRRRRGPPSRQEPRPR